MADHLEILSDMPQGGSAWPEVWAKLTPSMGDWATMRTSPLAWMPAGQWTMKGSLMPLR